MRNGYTMLSGSSGIRRSVVLSISGVDGKLRTQVEINTVSAAQVTDISKDSNTGLHLMD